MSVEVNDSRRFLELAELYLDDDLSASDTSELRALLEADASLVQRLHALLRDQVLCRTALRPSDPKAIGERAQRMIDSWRPQSGEIAAQAVFARVDQRRRVALVLRWSSLAAAALVVVLILPLVWSWFLRPAVYPDPAAPVISAVMGDVRLGALALQADGEKFVYGTTLRTASQASATLTWTDGTSLTLSGNSVLTRLPKLGYRLQLDVGTAAIVAVKRPADQALEIVCPDATARVVGTAFSISVTNGQSRLAVSEGVVRWQRDSDGVSSLVGAGQQVDAARLPLPSPVVLSVAHLAALRTAIAAGREPWASDYAALRSELSMMLDEVIPPATDLRVPDYGSEREEHSAARRFLMRVTRPLVGLALIARLEGHAEAEAGARKRLHALTTITLTGPEAATLGCDMLAIYGLQGADLLRGLPSWQADDDARIAAWIERELRPHAERWYKRESMSVHWRGAAAFMSIAAWRGDQPTMLRLMQDMRTSIATQLTAPVATRLSANPEVDQTLYQALSHALYTADVARIAGGDITPPPDGWRLALDAYIAGLRSSKANLPQHRQFLHALTGPLPWREPTATAQVDVADKRSHIYCWYFPALLAQDPRWE